MEAFGLIKLAWEHKEKVALAALIAVTVFLYNRTQSLNREIGRLEGELATARTDNEVCVASVDKQNLRVQELVAEGEAIRSRLEDAERRRRARENYWQKRLGEILAEPFPENTPDEAVRYLLRHSKELGSWEKPLPLSPSR